MNNKPQNSKIFAPHLRIVRLLFHLRLIRPSQAGGNGSRGVIKGVAEPVEEKVPVHVHEEDFKSPEKYLWFCDTFTKTSSPLRHLQPRF